MASCAIKILVLWGLLQYCSALTYKDSLAFAPCSAIVAQRLNRVNIGSSSRKSLSLRGGSGSTQMSLNLAQVAKTGTLVYAVLVGAGGIFAGIKSGSKPSVISGITAGTLLAIAYMKNNNPLALGTAAALTIVFAIRYAKTKKVMPAGFLGVLSFLCSLLFGFAQFS